MRQERAFRVKELMQSVYKIEYDADRLQSSGYGSIEEYIEREHEGNPWKAVADGEVVVAIWPVAKTSLGPAVEDVIWEATNGKHDT